MNAGLFKGVLHIDQPITDLTGTVCQPGRYEVFDFEGPDHSAGITGSWVGLMPVTISEAQAQFFADYFPERFTFDPDTVLPAFAAGRDHLAEEQKMEDAQTKEWQEEGNAERRLAELEAAGDLLSEAEEAERERLRRGNWRDS